METHKMTPNQTKILAGMDKVYDKLISDKNGKKIIKEETSHRY